MKRESSNVKGFGRRALQLLLPLTLGSIIISLSPSEAGTSKAPTGSALEREATDAFNHAEYDRVLKLWQSLPPETTASKSLIRLAFQSSLKLGRPEEALTLYQRLVPADQPDDPGLLRPLALSFLTSHVRMRLVSPAPQGPKTALVIKTEEKGSDVNLAAHLHDHLRLP